MRRAGGRELSFGRSKDRWAWVGAWRVETREKNGGNMKWRYNLRRGRFWESILVASAAN